MSTYYPIEFLPENQKLGEPNTRNYLRNNLPYEDSSDTQQPENVVAVFGKNKIF